MTNKQEDIKRQAHLFKHCEALVGRQKQMFREQLNQIDIAKINQLYDSLCTGNTTVNPHQSIAPILPHNPTAEQVESYKKIGNKALKGGKVAALLLAGGQGSRLGHDGPKGTYDIGVSGGKSLFELHANYLKRQNNTIGHTMTWLIMTSVINHAATVRFFDENNYFGYPKDKITFFEQGMIEAVDFDGKIIIESETKISRSPDGNGGCFRALKENKIIDKLIADGCEWLFIFNVDNAIVNIADPLFIGFTIDAQCACSAKVVEKTMPSEKVGIPCMADGRPTIVEYSEMSSDMIEARDDSGKLLYRGGNIGNYCISLAELKRYLAQPLNYHLATKKIAYLDDNGQTVKPSAPNGYKFELFIFDIFPAFSDMAVLQVVRELEFAPVKNATGNDSPETAKQLYNNKFSVK